MGAKITSYEISTLQAGVFYFYKVSVSYLVDGMNGKLSFNEKKWASLNKGFNASATDIGLTQTLVPKIFPFLNATYKISLENDTDIDKGIIKRSDLLDVFFGTDKKGYTSALFEPVALLKNLLKVLNMNKTCSFDDTFFLNPFPSGLGVSLPLLKNIISSMTDFNPIMFFTSLYESVGIFFYQDIPDDPFNSTGNDSSQNITLHAFYLRNINAFPNVDNGGVIAFNDSVDFSKVKRMASYSLGPDGNISPVNPWTQGQNFDKLSLKSKMFKLDSNYASQSLAIGSSSVYSMNAPLINFFEKTRPAYKLDKSDDDNKKSASKGGKDDKGGKGGNSIVDIFAPAKKNTNDQDQFNGQFMILKVLVGVVSIKNVMNFHATDLSFLSKIGHCQITSFDSNSSNSIKLQKFDLSSNTYSDSGTLNLPSAKYFIMNVHIKKFITSDDTPTYITNATVVDLDDISQFLVSKSNEKSLIKALKEMYGKVSDSSDDSSNKASTNSDLLASANEEYSNISEIDDSLLGDVLNECMASDDIESLLSSDTASSSS